MKTPMQEMIKILKERLSSKKEIQATAYPEVKYVLEAGIGELEMCIGLAELMLKQEKAVIMDSYWDGGQDIPIHIGRCEEYYNKTFKTKER